MYLSYTYHAILCLYTDSKLASFQRQLNLYGFRRYTEGNIPSAYWNSKFLRDQPQLVPEMKRNLARNEKNEGDKNGEKSGTDRHDKLIRSDSIVTSGTSYMNDETFDTYVTTPTGNEHLTVSPRSDITMDEAYPNPYHPSNHHLNQQQQAQYRGKTVIPLDAWQNEQTFSLSDPQGLLSSEEINVQKKDKNTNRKRRKNNTTQNNNTPTTNTNSNTPNNKSSSTTVSELSEDGDETVASSTMSPHMFSSRFTTSDLSRPNHTGGYYNSTNYSATYINGIVSPPSPTTLSVMKGSSIGSGGSGGGGALNLMSVTPVDYHTGDHMSVPPSTAPKLYSLENINGVDCFVPVTLNSSTHSIAPILSRSGSVSSMASHHVSPRSTPSYHDHKPSVPPSPGGANSCPCCAVNPHNAMQAVNHLIPHFAVTYNPPCAYVNGVDPLNSSCHSVMSNFSNHGAIPLPPPAMMHKPAPGLSPLMTDLSVNSLNAGMNNFQLDNPTRSPHHHPHVITSHCNPHAPLSPRVGRSLPNTPSLSRHQSAQSFFNGPYPLPAPLVSAPSSPSMSYNTKRKRNQQPRNTNTTSALFSRQQSYNSFDAIEFYNKSMQEEEAKARRIMTGDMYTGAGVNNTTTHSNTDPNTNTTTNTHTTIVSSSNSGNTSSGELSSELLEGGLILGDDAEFIKMFSDPNSEHYIPISTL